MWNRDLNYRQRWFKMIEKSKRSFWEFHYGQNLRGNKRKQNGCSVKNKKKPYWESNNHFYYVYRIFSVFLWKILKNRKITKHLLPDLPLGLESLCIENFSAEPARLKSKNFNQFWNISSLEYKFLYVQFFFIMNILKTLSSPGKIYLIESDIRQNLLMRQNSVRAVQCNAFIAGNR